MTTERTESPYPSGVTIYGLKPGQPYHVIQSFTDTYGNSFAQGETLHFKQRHFLPYEGGHTLVFEERSLYLQEEKNSEMIEHFSEYNTPVSFCCKRR